MLNIELCRATQHSSFEELKVLRRAAQMSSSNVKCRTIQYFRFDIKLAVGFPPDRTKAVISSIIRYSSSPL